VRDKVIARAFCTSVQANRACCTKRGQHTHSKRLPPSGAPSSSPEIISITIANEHPFVLAPAFVDYVRIEHFFSDCGPVDSPKKARPEAHVAGCLNLIHFNYEGITITVY
jgi:hypothetical protein